MNYKALIALIIVIVNLPLSAQHHRCGQEEHMAKMESLQPGLLEDIQRTFAPGMAENRFSQRGLFSANTMYIPVHVIIVHKPAHGVGQGTNLSKARILSQIEVLNKDYSRTNADTINTPIEFSTGNASIQFCMASIDPDGNPTDGITRYPSTANFDDEEFAIKGETGWPREYYLNIWVAEIEDLGYAYIPSLNGLPNSTLDGVVVNTIAFGGPGFGAEDPYDLGRTATHEVGHFLGLQHVWRSNGCNSDDGFSDTPLQDDENYGCPVHPSPSCSNNGDMFMNYMDYTDDACMNLFTTGQKNRMQALFAGGGSRAALASSPGCQPPGGGGSCGTPSGLSATNVTQTSATLNWGSVSGATSYNLQWRISGGSWNTVNGISATSYSLTGLSAGTTYNFQVQAVCSGRAGSYSSAASFTTASGNCSDQYEANNTRNTAKVIPVNQNITAQIATSTDKDWNRFSNTSATPKIKIELTTLPADYDVQLYRNNSYLAVSQNAGNANELIIYNTTTVSSSYYAYVYGYNGAFSNSQCYTLRVSLSSANWRTDGSTDGEVEELEIPVEFVNAGFGMYPNPATEQLTLEVPMESEADVQVAILDVAGKVTLQQHRTLAKGDNQMTLDVSRLPNGIYFVQVRNGEQLHTRKLTVQH